MKVNERIKAFVNECNDTNKEKALAYLLQKQKEELNKRLLKRDKEIDMIKTSERGFNFLNMNNKMISREEELSQKKKEYEIFFIIFKYFNINITMSMKTILR